MDVMVFGFLLLTRLLTVYRAVRLVFRLAIFCLLFFACRFSFPTFLSCISFCLTLISYRFFSVFFVHCLCFFTHVFFSSTFLPCFLSSSYFSSMHFSGYCFSIHSFVKLIFLPCNLRLFPCIFSFGNFSSRHLVPCLFVCLLVTLLRISACQTYPPRLTCRLDAWVHSISVKPFFVRLQGRCLGLDSTYGSKLGSNRLNSAQLSPGSIQLGSGLVGRIGTHCLDRDSGLGLARSLVLLGSRI